MRYLLLLLFAAGIMTAQNTPLQPAKKLVVGGNGSATIGQVVAGYTNDYHVGIRIPFRAVRTSVQEEMETIFQSLYPNPCNGRANLSTRNVRSFEVSDLFGTIVYRFENTDGVNGIQTFELPNRGVYFVKMTSNSGSNGSTILINQ